MLHNKAPPLTDKSAVLLSYTLLLSASELGRYMKKSNNIKISFKG